MFFTRLCLEELERSSPDVKVSQLYMRRRCREKWSRMGEEERAAIFRLAAARDGNDLQQEDLNDNNYTNDDGADAVEVEVDDEWQPEKKRKRSQSQRRPSAFNAFCLVEREKRGHKINNRCLNHLFCGIARQLHLRSFHDEQSRGLNGHIYLKMSAKILPNIQIKFSE